MNSVKNNYKQLFLWGKIKLAKFDGMICFIITHFFGAGTLIIKLKKPP